MSFHRLVSRTVSILVCLVGLVVMPLPVLASGPTEQIRATVEQAIAVLKEPTLAGEAGLEARRAKLRDLIFARFDFDKMAQGAVGFSWRQFTPKQKKDFVAAFSHILESSYLGKIESYEGETFTFLKEVDLNSNLKRVDSTVDSKGQQFKLSYSMVQTAPGEWKVYDVIIEGVGLVSNYRSQFSQMLQSGTVDELIARLEKKVKENDASDAKSFGANAPK